MQDKILSLWGTGRAIVVLVSILPARQTTKYVQEKYNYATRSIMCNGADS